MSETKILTLEDIENQPEVNKDLGYFMRPENRHDNIAIDMADAARRFPVSAETLSSWSERAEDPFWTRQGKGFVAGVERTLDSFGDMGANFKNLDYRYVFPDSDEEESKMLMEIGLRNQMSKKQARAYIEHHEGTDDSIMANISGGLASALAYGGAGLVAGAVGGPGAAVAVIGGLSGAQMGLEKAEEFAETYAKKTGDYSLENYDKTNDLIALGYGAVGGWIETKLGAERIIADALGRSSRATLRRAALGFVEEGAEEYLQEYAGGVAGKIAGLEDRTWEELLKDSLISGVYGAVVGGIVGGGMYYYHRGRLAKLFHDAGFDKKESRIMADNAIDNTKSKILKEVSTVTSLEKHFGSAYNDLIGKIESALDAAGWDKTQIDPKTKLPRDKHEYAKAAATDIAYQVLRQAKINKVPVSDILDLADIVAIKNVLYLKPKNLGTIENIEALIKQKKAEKNALIKSAQTMAGDSNRKSLLNTQIAVLQNLLDLKKSQLKAKQDARPQELKDRSELAKTDVKALEKSDNVVDFAKNISTPDQQVTPVEAKKRHDDATIMWLLDGDKNAFESLIEIGNTGNKVLSGILNSIESIYQFQKENPEIDLRADIQGALKRLPDALSGNFAEYVSLPSNFNENALLYAFAFGSADDINTFLNKYMDKIKANKENGKFQAGTFRRCDAYAQCLKMFKDAFDGSVAKDVNMRGVMLSMPKRIRKRPEYLHKNAQTIKQLFDRRINLDFARNEGILQALGYDESSPVTRIHFPTKGGITDWQDIVNELETEGIMQSYSDTYEGQDKLIDYAKNLLLNTPNVKLYELRNRDSDIKAIEKDAKIAEKEQEAQMDSLLKESKLKLTDDDLKKMSFKQKSDKLAELYPTTIEDVTPDLEALEEWDDAFWQIDETEQVSPLRYRDYDYIGKRIWTYDVNGKKHYIEPMVVLADDTVVPLISLRDSIFPDKQVYSLYKSEGGQSPDLFRDIWSKLIRNIESIIRGKDFGKMDNGTYENLAEADNKKLLLDALEKTKKEIQEENVSDADTKAQIAVVDNFIDNIKDGYIKPRFNEIVSLSDGTHLVTHGVSGKPEDVKEFLKAGKVYNPSLYIDSKPSAYGFHSVILFAEPSILKRKDAKIFDRDAYTVTLSREPVISKTEMPNEEKLHQAMDNFNKYFDLEYDLFYKHSGSSAGDFALSMESGLENIKDPYYWNGYYLDKEFVKKYIIVDAIERGLVDVDKTTLYKSQNNGKSLETTKIAETFGVEKNIGRSDTITEAANKALELIGKQENKTRDEVLDSYKELAVSRKDVVKSTGEDATVENIAKAQRLHKQQSGRWGDVVASINDGYAHNASFELLEFSGDTGILASIFTREMPFDVMVAEKGKTGKHYESVESRKKIRKYAILSAKGNLLSHGKIYAAFLPPHVKKTDVAAYMRAMRNDPENVYGRSDADAIVAEIEKMAKRFAKIYKTLSKEEQDKLTSGKVEEGSDLETKIKQSLEKNGVKNDLVIDYATTLMKEVYNHPVSYFEGKVLSDVGTNEFVGAYVNESPNWDSVAAMLEGQGVKVVRGSPSDVKDATARLEEKLGLNIRFQGSKKQGMYDPELQVIIIGKDFNTGTLPHEMAHFWLDDIFRRATTYNDWTPEFVEQANNLFAILGIEENQKQLTREQHEKFARMVENIVFGLQPAPAGAELPTLAYLNWIPEKYKSIADIRYKDEDGTYHYPLLDKDAADFFNAWYSNTSLPDIGTSPLEIQNENFTDRNGDVVPSTPEIMKLRDNTQEQAVKDQADVDKEMHDSGVENTPTDTRAEMVAYNTQASREATTPEPVVQPQPKKKSILRIGRGTNTRAEMIEEAQKYIEKNKDHAEEIAFGDPELVENDSGIERGILIREVMNNYKKGSQEYATLYDNLARTMSLAGKTGGLNNDIQVRFYLEGYSRLNKAMEAKAAAKYAGSNRGAITKFNQDIQAFIASKADAILATEPGSKERNDLIDAMIREAEIKFAGGTGDARMLFQENNFGQKARRQNKADFMKWADKEIKKMLKANPESDPNVISELITKSEKAQVARTQLDSKDVNQCVAAAQILREWQAYTDSLDDVVLDNQISKLNRWFRKIVGGWQPFAMLTNINTHTTNMVSNTINLATVQASLAAQYGKSQVDSALIKKESDRIWAIYNATQMDISQMLNPATPSLLHGEKIDVNAKNKLRVLDTRMWLGKEDLLFRSKVYLSTLAHIATKNAKASGKSANELFEQYCNLTQDPGSEAEQVRQQAVLMGNIATFTQNGKFSGVLQKVRTEINKFTDPTGRAGFGTMLAPFLKTPANIVELGVRATFAPITDIAALLKKSWGVQDTLNTVYFLLAIILSAAVDDYEKEYESGKKYDPTKPYDSVNFGGKAWFKLDLFGALETPLRFLSALKTNKGLGISGVVNSTPLAGDISESISGIERASKSGEKLLSFGINYAYNQVNKSVPAIIKQTANLANMTDLNLEQVDIGIKTGIGRKVGRQYGLDAQERTDVELYNDILGTFFNRLKLTE